MATRGCWCPGLRKVWRGCGDTLEISPVRHLQAAAPRTGEGVLAVPGVPSQGLRPFVRLPAPWSLVLS